jgi:hypothetical protein
MEKKPLTSLALDRVDQEPRSFSDVAALHFRTDHEVAGERVGKYRIPESSAPYLRSNCAVNRTTINHRLKPQRRTKTAQVEVDSHEDSRDAKTLEVGLGDQMLPACLGCFHPSDPRGLVVTQNH